MTLQHTVDAGWDMERNGLEDKRVVIWHQAKPHVTDVFIFILENL
jgi:hypothetical protein